MILLSCWMSVQLSSILSSSKPGGSLGNGAEIFTARNAILSSVMLPGRLSDPWFGNHSRFV
jgi:hypothetical protein